MPVAPIVLGSLAAAQGLTDIVQGRAARQAGEREQRRAIERFESIDIEELNRPAMNQMLMRSRQGLPAESLAYAERGAERAAGASLSALEDRRAGLTGIGQAQQTLADTYMQLGSMDAERRLASEQMYNQAMLNQAQQVYDQESSLADMQLALARGERLEGINQRNAGVQNLFQGASLASYGFTPNLGSPLEDAAANNRTNSTSQTESVNGFNFRQRPLSLGMFNE